MILIGNGKVITRDKARPYLEKGAVLVDGRNILKIFRIVADRESLLPQEILKLVLTHWAA